MSVAMRAVVQGIITPERDGTVVGCSPAPHGRRASSNYVIDAGLVNAT